MHHINPLKEGLFPTAALPAWLRHSSWNLKLLSLPEHTAAHAALKRSQAYLSSVFNPGTTAVRVAQTAGNECECRQ